MAFELKTVVPWGRNLEEYSSFFSLTNKDLNKRIISFGDGPASFNAEMYKKGKTVISIDPIYRFCKDELQQRIEETKAIVLEQTKNNSENFVWKHIHDIDDLEQRRTNAMKCFINDFEQGKKQGRYIPHELPNQLQHLNRSFDIGLSSHFLILYSQLGIEFHSKSITELLRLCNEIRIFPIVNLNAETSEVLEGIINWFKPHYHIMIKRVDYEFQKNGNRMLVIKHKYN